MLRQLGLLPRSGDSYPGGGNGSEQQQAGPQGVWTKSAEVSSGGMQVALWEHSSRLTLHNKAPQTGLT